MRELEKVRFIMKEATGLDVAYAYDDIVFAEDAVYILCFDDDDSKKLHCYFNRDCFGDVKTDFTSQLIAVSVLNGMQMDMHGVFELKQKEGTEEMEVYLYENEVNLAS